MKWRHKIVIPTVATLPLLMVYYIGEGPTTVILPNFVVGMVGFGQIHLGIFYYFYIAMLSIFCTNAINILAGINGIEAGTEDQLMSTREDTDGVRRPPPW